MLKKTGIPNATHRPSIVFAGRESVGKSQLISSLSGKTAREANFRGSTVSVERYRCGEFEFIDTPGIHRLSDTETTRRALACLSEHDRVVLVVQGTSLDDDLVEMLPFTVGKTGIIVVTFWDKVQPGEAALEAIERLAHHIGVPMIPVNGRSLCPAEREKILQSLSNDCALFTRSVMSIRAGWRIEPKPGIFENRYVGPWLAMTLLLLPALATIFLANTVAGWLHPIVAKAMEPLLATVDTTLPKWMAGLLNAKIDEFGYGLLNMGPFLFVWALPTVLLFSIILAIYKTTGLIERMNAALHPWSKCIGLSGRDLVRVVIGFGCNVPAVIGTRACSCCSRQNAMAAIAFGSACSYQLPATLAVLAAASKQLSLCFWILPTGFLAYLFITTVIYLRLTAPAQSRSSLNLLMHPQRPFLHWPTFNSITREAIGSLKQFLFTAIPIFAIICIVASTAAQLGALQWISKFLEPVMALVNLPPQAEFPVILASIRKDGIFLFAGSEGLSMPMNPIQTLTAVYLAGVLLPCIVTALAIMKESNWRQTAQLLARQAAFAIAFSMILAWSGESILLWLSAIS